MVTTTSGTAIAVKAMVAGGRAKMPSSGNICLAIAPAFRMNLRVVVPRARPMEPNPINMGFGEAGRAGRGLTGGTGEARPDGRGALTMGGTDAAVGLAGAMLAGMGAPSAGGVRIDCA